MDVQDYGDGASRGLSVTISIAADRETVLETARVIHESADAAGWPGHVVLQRENPEPYDANLDMTTMPAWTLQVFPGDIDIAAVNLAALLDLEANGGVGPSTVIDGWPYVQIATLDTFSAEFHRVSALPEFAQGATYSLQNSDHLRIVHVPTRTSDEAIDAIIALAIDYPDAEILLQATTAGPQWPMLYVARLTAEQAAAIDTRLRNPALADADVEGYPVDFQLSVITGEGPAYTFGTFGDVPK